MKNNRFGRSGLNNFKFVFNKDSVLARSLSQYYGNAFLEIDVDHFADSETYIKKIEYSPENVLIVNQFYFSNIIFSSINNQFLDFLFLIDVLKKNGSKNIMAFLPYLPYSRQDKYSSLKEIGLIEIVSKFLKTAGVNKLITCELHAPEIIEKLDLKIENIDISPFWFKIFKSEKFKDLIKNDFSNVCFVAPDYGAKSRNQKLADNTGSGFAFIEKIRIAPDSPVAFGLHGDDVKGKTAIIVDDIIDTGKTAIKACDLILEHGAKKVIGCFVHAVLSSGSIEIIEKSSFDTVFITDTILIDRNSLGKKFFVVEVDKFLANYFSSLVLVKCGS